MNTDQEIYLEKAKGTMLAVADALTAFGLAVRDICPPIDYDRTALRQALAAAVGSIVLIIAMLAAIAICVGLILWISLVIAEWLERRELKKTIIKNPPPA